MENAETTAEYAVIHHGDPCKVQEYSPSSRPKIVVTRHLTEGWLHRDHVKCCNLADAVWVPTRWHQLLFVDAGVEPSKLFVLPEAIDSDFYKPNSLQVPDAGDKSSMIRANTCLSTDKSSFEFLSIFAFGHRKGWDLLLDAFFTEFTPQDNVTLVLRAYKRENVKATHVKNDRGEILLDRPKMNADIEFMSANITEHVEGYARRTLGKELKDLPAIRWIPDVLSREDMRALYERADAFVLPTRGEGWGLPAVEAMSMELPVIVTNYTGPTAYLTPNNSFALRSGDPDSATGFATPSLPHLRTLMRYVFEHQEEARERGHQARRDVVAWFHPQVLKDRFLFLLKQVERRVTTASASGSFPDSAGMEASMEV